MTTPNAIAVASLAALGLLAGAALARQARGGAALAQTFAAGLLLALIGVDLIPDALSGEADPAQSAVAVLVAFTVVAAGGHRLLRQGACCSYAATFSSAGIALHGVLEGMVLGLGLGVDSGAGPELLLAFCLHKMGEGFALLISLRSARTSPARIRVWMMVAASAPLAGAGLGSLLTVPEPAAPVLTAALAGVLAAVAVTMLDQPGPRRDRVAHGVSLIAGVTVMGVATGLAG